MSFPSPLGVVGAFIVALLGVSTTFLLSRVLKLRTSAILTGEVRGQAFFALLLFIVEFSTIAIFRYVYGPGRGPASGVGVSYGPFDVLVELVRSGLVILLPLAIIVWATRQNRASLGIRKEEPAKMIALGIVPSAIYLTLLVLLVPLVGGAFANITASSLTSGFIGFLLVGLSEEIVWRGYVQTRLVARTTKLYGWVAASLLFSLWHLPINYLYYGGVLEAFATSLLIQFPLGLALGYMMMKSQNILPSSIYHMFFDWGPSFFQIPGL